MARLDRLQPLGLLRCSEFPKRYNIQSRLDADLQFLIKGSRVHSGSLCSKRSGGNTWIALLALRCASYFCMGCGLSKPPSSTRARLPRQLLGLSAPLNRPRHYHYHTFFQTSSKRDIFTFLDQVIPDWKTHSLKILTPSVTTC